jgi:hypothetical protein
MDPGVPTEAGILVAPLAGHEAPTHPGRSLHSVIGLPCSEIVFDLTLLKQPSSSPSYRGRATQPITQGPPPGALPPGSVSKRGRRVWAGCRFANGLPGHEVGTALAMYVGQHKETTRGSFPPTKHRPTNLETLQGSQPQSKPPKSPQIQGYSHKRPTNRTGSPPSSAPGGNARGTQFLSAKKKTSLCRNGRMWICHWNGGDEELVTTRRSYSVESGGPRLVKLNLPTAGRRVPPSKNPPDPLNQG